MIEVSHQTVEDVSKFREQKKAQMLDQALEDVRRINELKRSPNFQWFISLILEEVRELEERILTPRLVKDEDMPAERQKLIEWRKVLMFLEHKENEVQNLLERNSKEK